MRWRVILNGDSVELKLLAESFTGPKCLIQHDGDNYTMSSAEFESLDDPNKIAESARANIEHINGAILLAFGSTTLVSCGAVYEMKPEGGRTIYASDHGKMNFRTIVTEAAQEIRPGDPIRQWTDLASGDKAVADVLALLGTKPADWVNLYRIYEILERDSGGIETRGWATAATVRNFKHTANHPESAGRDSRHGRMPAAPPKKPMLLSEARSLVFSIVLGWLREK